MGCLLKQGGGLYPRLRIGAVLLAAGEGRRMGGIVKPLIRLQGVPLINRQLVALSGAGVDEVVVVTGYARAAVEAQMQRFPIILVHNEAHVEGRERSVSAGLAGLNGEFDAVFVVLADQPLVGTDDLIELIAAFKKRTGGHVVVPRVGTQTGNPVLLDNVALTRILDGDTSLAGRRLVECHPDLVHVHETANQRFVTELDTVEDVEALAQRTGWRLELPAMETAA